MIEVGGFGFHLYGLMVGLGILTGFWVASRFARKFEIPTRKADRRNSPKSSATGQARFEITSSDVWDALWWVFIPGVLGARLYHVLDYWSYYRENPLLIPAVWTGGMGIFGAIGGGILGLWMYCLWMCSSELRSLDRNLLGRKRFGLISLHVFVKLARLLAWPSDRRKFVKLPALQKKEISYFSYCLPNRFFGLLDLAAFGLPVGQAIGRWGNFFNQELYGLPTDLPWGLAIPLEKRLPGFEQHTHFHPLFLYESVYSILVFGLLLLIWRVKGGRVTSGSYFALYLMLYGVGRFFFEGLRIESWIIDGVNVAKTLGVLAVVIGVVFLYSNIGKEAHRP